MKFKVGDWVTNSEGFLFQVREDILFAKDDFTKWQPKEGDWCWFSYNSECNACFGRFIGMDGSKFIAGETCSHTYSYPYCEPFIGELPSFIKDKQ